jgi:hypothetical protein
MEGFSSMSNEPAEVVSDKNDTRLVRLSFYHGYVGGHDDTGIHEYFAEINLGRVTLWKTSTNMPPREFRMDIEDAERFAHALLSYQGDQAKREQQERDAFKDEIEATMLRAEALDIQMVEQDGWFSLSCARHHPLAHVLDRWCIVDQLTLSVVQERLQAIETFKEESQTADDSKGVSNYTVDLDKLPSRAESVGATLKKLAYYELTFPVGHPFFAFWYSDTLLPLGQVVYRLNYVEAVVLFRYQRQK